MSGRQDLNVGGTSARIHRSGSVDISLSADALRKLRLEAAGAYDGRSVRNLVPEAPPSAHKGAPGNSSPFQNYAARLDSFEAARRAPPPPPAGQMGSTFGSGAVAGSSAVVVSAMTALQERIRHLEGENARLTDEVNELALVESEPKNYIRAAESELVAQHAAQMSKLNGDLDEKIASLNAMTTRASCAEETIAALRREVDYLKERLRELDGARSSIGEKCNHAEQRSRDLERELADQRRKYDDQAAAVKAMEESNAALLENAERARQKLAEGLKREHTMRIEQEEKYLKSEEMLRNVVELNEGLVGKLSTLNEEYDRVST